MVDKSSSEQQFCKSDAITFIVVKIWSHTPSAIVGLTAGWQTVLQAIRQNTGRFENLKFSTDCIISIFTAFNKGTVLSYAFSQYSQVKLIVRCVLEEHKT